MNQVTISYQSSVMVDAGWRSVEITALAEKLSEKRAKVVKVLLIDGEEPAGYTSRTGAKRQTYNASGVAKREVDAVKILSKCNMVQL